MEKKEKRILKPYHGIIFYVISIVALMFPGAMMQYYWGIPGLIATELMYLALSLLYVLILRGDFKKVFPIRKVKLVSIFGTILLWGGTFLVVMLCTMILVCFFPEQMMSTSEGLNEAFSSMSLGVQLLVVGLLPAICEESVHRGVIMNSFRPIRNKWIVIISVGVLFGINHLDIWRLVPTALLGIALTYVAYETDNILYSVLYHFINNGFSSVASSLSTSVSTSAEGVTELVETGTEMFSQPEYVFMVIGMYMIMACVAPFLIYTASYMVRLGKADASEVTYFPKKNKEWVLGILIGLTAFLLLGGIALLVGSSLGVSLQLYV